MKRSPSDLRRAQRRAAGMRTHALCTAASHEAKEHQPLHPARSECYKRAHPLWLQVR